MLCAHPSKDSRIAFVVSSITVRPKDFTIFAISSCSPSSKSSIRTVSSGFTTESPLGMMGLSETSLVYLSQLRTMSPEWSARLTSENQ